MLAEDAIRLACSSSGKSLSPRSLSGGVRMWCRSGCGGSGLSWLTGRLLPLCLLSGGVKR